MDDNQKNNGLEVELVIRTRGYQLTLDVPNRMVRVRRLGDDLIVEFPMSGELERCVKC